MKRINVTVYEREHKHITTCYLLWSENGKPKKQDLEIGWKNDASDNEMEQVRAMAEAMRSAKQNEFNFQATGLYNKARLNIDFIEYANDFADSMDSDSEGEKCEHMVKRLVRHAGGKIPFFMITDAFCRGFRTYLKNKLAGETAQGYFRLFKKVIKQAKKDKLITENPAEDLPAIPIGDPMVIKEKLDEQELKQLFATPFEYPEVVRAARLAAVTGMGDAEIRTLQARQVSKKNMEITFRRQKNRNKSMPAVTVPITEETLLLLGDLSKADRLLFELPGNRDWVSKLVTRWVARAGIDKHITFYCLRHSCIQNLLDMGVEDSVVEDIAGWSNSSMRARYGKRSSNQKREAISKISR